jgi:putative inorganic carbon (HCO3(-)) transporter
VISSFEDSTAIFRFFAEGDNRVTATEGNELAASINRSSNWGNGRLELAIASLGAILAGSLLYTPIPLIAVVAFPAVYYFLSRPYELLLVMAFLIPFNFVFNIGPIPVASELIKVFAWIPFLIYCSARKERFKTSKYNWCFAVLGALLLLSVFRSHDLPFTVKESVRLGSNIGLCYLVLNLVDTREKVIQIFKVLAVSAFLVACYGFYQFAIQDFGGLFWIVNPRLDTSFSHGRFAFWEWRNRITSVLTSEMELGHYFNLCLPVGVVLWLTKGGRRFASKWLLMVVTMLAGLILTFTFAAWLSLLATSVFFVLLVNWKKRWTMIPAVALVLTLAVYLLAFGPLRPFVEAKLFETAEGGLAWDALTRWISWQLALKAWWSHPLIGVGYGNFPGLTIGNLDFLSDEWASSGSSPHNVYLYLLSELGLAGLMAVVIVIASNIRTSLQSFRAPAFRYVALALAFALTTTLVGGWSDDSPLYGPHSSYLVWLLIGMSEVVLNLAASNSRILGPMPR